MIIPQSLKSLAETIYTVSENAYKSAKSATAELFSSGARGLPVESGMDAFHFGDPEPVLKDNLIDYLGTFIDAGGYYTPPVYLRGLSKCRRANPHHGSILYFKRNMILKWMQENKYISHKAIRGAALDYVVLNNAYFQIVYNRLGGIMELRRLPSVLMRRGVDPGSFVQISPNGGEPTWFHPGEVIHLFDPDIDQDIYGIADYLAGLQAVLLSEETTLLRRKINVKGRMGYVFVASNAGLSEETSKKIVAKINETQGNGFGNLFINIKKTDSREPIKIVPIGDISIKDDYDKVKNMTIREVLAMHRAQPGLAGVVPENTAGFGDLNKIMMVYVDLEVPSMQSAFLELNEFLPTAGKLIFDPPAWKNMG